MHILNLKFYCFINQFDKVFINNLANNVSVIYRNYSSNNHLNTIKKIKQTCEKKGLKFYLSNNIKLAIKLNLNGAYIPSFNKDFSINNFSLKKNFEILGSAHSLKEIRIKEKQNVNYIFLSPIFYSSKSKRNLGIYRFNNLRKLTNKKIVALGGIKITNLNLLKKMNISNAASISLFLK
ncbi:MAG: thiamine phosphate synthase [Pelagibacterales bacterium MED-G42]|nr:MAG: thiamine phosphate synthase [Pelagibacterales bacterium MED-G42]|tara:strand:+ start:37 stop:573 length:537 start_codon:yes stop_codon:yes gene_type:complete